jgi:hypothetical protein
MGTRSRIAVMHGSVCKSVYCHWDGYLEHNGSILQKHYDSTKANQLVALGDLSSLRPEIGEKHAFSKFEPATGIEHREHNEDWCTFYGRDRGETNVSWQTAHTFDEFFEQVENSCGEWYYVMKDGVWYVGNVYSSDSRYYKQLVPLTEALALLPEDAEVA